MCILLLWYERLYIYIHTYIYNMYMYNICIIYMIYTYMCVCVCVCVYIYIINISVKSIWSRALFSASISLLIFCLKGKSIFDSGVLKSPCCCLLFFFSPSRFSLYIWLLLCWVHICLQCLCLNGFFPWALWSVLLCLFLWLLLWSLFCLI